jgi:hypothetical protein
MPNVIELSEDSDFPGNHDNENPEEDVNLNSSSQNPNEEEEEETTDRSNDDSVVSFADSVLSLTGRSSSSSGSGANISDPQLRDLHVQIQRTQQELKRVKRTFKKVKGKRNTDLRSLKLAKMEKGRQLWVKEYKSRRHVTLADYKAMILELSVPPEEYDISPATLTAEAKLLRAQHHSFMVERQRDISNQVHQSILEYVGQIQMPQLKQEKELAEMVAHTQISKLKQTKQHMIEQYQEVLGIQRKIMTKLRLRELESRSGHDTRQHAATTTTDIMTLEQPSELSLDPLRNSAHVRMQARTTAAQNMAQRKLKRQTQNQKTMEDIDALENDAMQRASAHLTPEALANLNSSTTRSGGGSAKGRAKTSTTSMSTSSDGSTSFHNESEEQDDEHSSSESSEERSLNDGDEKEEQEEKEQEVTEKAKEAGISFVMSEMQVPPGSPTKQERERTPPVSPKLDDKETNNNGGTSPSPSSAEDDQKEEEDETPTTTSKEEDETPTTTPEEEDGTTPTLPKEDDGTEAWKKREAWKERQAWKEQTEFNGSSEETPSESPSSKSKSSVRSRGSQMRRQVGSPTPSKNGSVSSKSKSSGHSNSNSNSDSQGLSTAPDLDGEGDDQSKASNQSGSDHPQGTEHGDEEQVHDSEEETTGSTSGDAVVTSGGGGVVEARSSSRGETRADMLSRARAARVSTPSGATRPTSLSNRVGVGGTGRASAVGSTTTTTRRNLSAGTDRRNLNGPEAATNGLADRVANRRDLGNRMASRGGLSEERRAEIRKGMAQKNGGSGNGPEHDDAATAEAS